MRRYPEMLSPGLSEIALAGKLNARAMELGNLNLLRARGFNNNGLQLARYQRFQRLLSQRK